jgi:hypothetical protein
VARGTHYSRVSRRSLKEIAQGSVAGLVAAIAWGGLVSMPMAVHAADLRDFTDAALLNAPLELDLLNPEVAATDPEVVTADTISQAGMTVPSLWFMEEQIAEQFSPRLVEHWVAYEGSDTRPRRIDLVVNPQIWSILNYLERYTFINRFGSTARDYAYDVRVMNRQNALLGIYSCDYSAIADTTEPSPAIASGNKQVQATAQVPWLTSTSTAQVRNCNVYLDSWGPGGLRGRSNPFGEF